MVVDTLGAVRDSLKAVTAHYHGVADSLHALQLRQASTTETRSDLVLLKFPPFLYVAAASLLLGVVVQWYQIREMKQKLAALDAADQERRSPIARPTRDEIERYNRDTTKWVGRNGALLSIVFVVLGLGIGIIGLRFLGAKIASVFSTITKW